MALITGKTLIAALVNAGVVREGERIGRVVIDAQVDHAVVLYIERFVEHSILDVALTLDGVRIREVGPADVHEG
jgi:hypothetical protein